MKRQRPTAIQAALFESIFHFPVGQYWNQHIGFDVMALHSYLQIPSGKPTKEFIREQYGSEAVGLIEALVETPSTFN